MSNATPRKPAVCTIGYTKKSLQQFIELLQGAGVEKVVDIRRNNTSQLAGFSKKNDLAYILRLVNIDYEHMPDLAPSQELLSSWSENHDWEAYQAGFTKEAKERGMHEAVKRLAASPQRICLLCAEHKPDKCHRRLVAEWVKSVRPEVEIIHLV